MCINYHTSLETYSPNFVYIFAIANFEDIYAVMKCYANKDRKKTDLR